MIRRLPKFCQQLNTAGSRNNRPLLSFFRLLPVAYNRNGPARTTLTSISGKRLSHASVAEKPVTPSPENGEKEYGHADHSVFTQSGVPTRAN